jgi:PASTA domain
MPELLLATTSTKSKVNNDQSEPLRRAVQVARTPTGTARGCLHPPDYRILPTARPSTYRRLSSVVCTPAAITENGTTSTVPCPIVTETVPNVVGMNTPTGVVRVQAAGLAPVPRNEHSPTVPNGYVIGASPSAGTRVPAHLTHHCG